MDVALRGDYDAPVIRRPFLAPTAMPSRRPVALAAAWRAGAVLVSGAVLLAGCAGPRMTPADRDGPGARIPANLMRVPDAVPRIEPVRSGGPNKPYEVLGQRYQPLLGDPVLAERGLASWYGAKFHGRSTALGETYDMFAMTAAHKTMPLPSYARVRNPANGREVVVRINDRGPFHADRIIDLSYTAALKLDLLRGVGLVEVERITHQALRDGTWRSAAVAVGTRPLDDGEDPIGDFANRLQAPR